MNWNLLLTVGCLLAFFGLMGLGSVYHYFRYEKKQKPTWDSWFENGVSDMPNDRDQPSEQRSKH